MNVVKGIIVPGIPHPLLCPEANEGWGRLRAGFEAAAQQIKESGAERLLIYSTMWPSVIGHQIQADPEPSWVHVDELFHDLGSIPYTFRIDAEFGHAFRDVAVARGLQARTVAYHGFPIDTGSVVALKLLNPDNRIPASIVSSTVYAARAETIVLGKAAREAIETDGKKTAVVVVMTLSNRLFTEFIEPHEDHIHSAKDEEWNAKLLEFFEGGRLEDVAQLSRTIQDQIRVQKVVNFKPMWWLSAVMGQHNRYEGDVLAYEALFGTGGAVITLTPTMSSTGDKEFDEENVEHYRGDRSVLGGMDPSAQVVPQALAASPSPSPSSSSSSTAVQDGRQVNTDTAPAPVGAYPHARREGDLLFLSGVGPRQPGTNAIPGGPVRDENGQANDYDVTAQTEAVIENVSKILEAAGSSLDQVVDVTVFLIDMDRDFKAYNAVYAKHFTSVGATRTTLAITALPTPIAVEFKVVARAFLG
jgi:reactive intermediate/imine deaminase